METKKFSELKGSEKLKIQAAVLQIMEQKNFVLDTDHNRHWPTFRENELPEPKYGMEVDCLVVRRSTNKSISTLHYVIDKFDCLGGYFERTPMEYVHSWCYLEQLSPLYPLFDSESTAIRVNKK